MRDILSSNRQNMRKQFLNAKVTLSLPALLIGGLVCLGTGVVLLGLAVYLAIEFLPDIIRMNQSPVVIPPHNDEGPNKEHAVEKKEEK